MRGGRWEGNGGRVRVSRWKSEGGRVRVDRWEGWEKSGKKG